MNAASVATWLTETSDPSDPKKCTEQILTIAPILPGSGSVKTPVKASSTASSAPAKKSAIPSAPAPAAAAAPNLMDFDSRPSSTAPPEPAASAQKHNLAASDHHNLLHPVSDPQQKGPIHQSTATTAPIGNPPKHGNLLDVDDDLHETTDKLSSLNVSHQAMQPSRTPLQRTDTETSDMDVFVDAEEK